MIDLSDLNNLYRAQDVIFFCEIKENRLQAMHDKAMYIPRKCNSASKCSNCIQHEQSKIILALPTNNLVREIFEKTLTEGLSCVNTWLSFNTELLMPNLTESDYKKMKIDKRFKAYKRDDLKVSYRIKLGNENYCHGRCILAKF